MAYSQRQQESNLLYFLTTFFDPAVKATGAFEMLDENTQKYATMSLLESFFWLHLGVKLNYFPDALSRRVFYEYGNKLLKAYQRILDVKMETRFSPPLQRILEGELSGRIALFGSNEQLPAPTDEITSVYQSSFLLVSGFLKQRDVPSLLEPLLFAKPNEWELVIGIHSGLGVSVSENVVNLTRGWRESGQGGLLRIIEFMQAYRNLFDDLNELFRNSNQSREQLSLLRRYLKEIQQWRLDFVSVSVRERFLNFARDTIKVASENIMKNGGQKPPDFEANAMAAIDNLLTDWGAPYGARSAST